MLRAIILYFARKKNPDFQLDESIPGGVMIGFMFSRFWALLRGMRILMYGKMPSWLFLGKRVQFIHGSNIEFGQRVQIKEGVLLNALGKGQMKIGNQVTIGAFSRVFISYSLNDLGSHIHIGDNVGIGDFAHLGGAGGLEIGDDCIIGPYLSCHPENHNYQEAGVPIRFQGVNRKGIRIGQNCWIGAKVTILDGVEIGDNCILAAGAVITRSMPAHSIIGGVPAKVIKAMVPPSAKTSKAMTQQEATL